MAIAGHLRRPPRRLGPAGFVPACIPLAGALAVLLGDPPLVLWLSLALTAGIFVGAAASSRSVHFELLAAPLVAFLALVAYPGAIPMAPWVVLVVLGSAACLSGIAAANATSNRLAGHAAELFGFSLFALVTTLPMLSGYVSDDLAQLLRTGRGFSVAALAYLCLITAWLAILQLRSVRRVAPAASIWVGVPADFAWRYVRSNTRSWELLDPQLREAALVSPGGVDRGEIWRHGGVPTGTRHRVVGHVEMLYDDEERVARSILLGVPHEAGSVVTIRPAEGGCVISNEGDLEIPFWLASFGLGFNRQGAEHCYSANRREVLQRRKAVLEHAFGAAPAVALGPSPA